MNENIDSGKIERVMNWAEVYEKIQKFCEENLT